MTETHCTVHSPTFLIGLSQPCFSFLALYWTELSKVNIVLLILVVMSLFFSVKFHACFHATSGNNFVFPRMPFIPIKVRFFIMVWKLVRLTTRENFVFGGAQTMQAKNSWVFIKRALKCFFTNFLPPGIVRSCATGHATKCSKVKNFTALPFYCGKIRIRQC